jgi:hypothetical protein
MHNSLKVMAAAVAAFSVATLATSPTLADFVRPLPLIQETTRSVTADVEPVQYRGSGGYGYREHYHSRRDAHRSYRSRSYGYRYRDPAAAGILGFGIGALFGQSLTTPQTRYYTYGGASEAHVQWCLQRFRSYDITSDTYLNYDGNRYRCNSPY